MEELIHGGAYFRNFTVYAASPDRVFAPFWPENRDRFCPFWSGIGMVFERNYAIEVYERIYRFNSKWVRKKKKYANSEWI